MRLLPLLALLLAPAVSAGSTRDVGPAPPPPGADVAHEARVALVIGNGAYASGPLKNPPNDAKAVAEALDALGFDVTLKTDLDYRGMMTAVVDFGQALKAGGVGVFFYAGHGIQAEGRNYLVPVDARITGEAYVKAQAVDLGTVLAGMEDAHNRLNIMILDACRNNPFERSYRSAASGLAMVDAPSGTLIAYATSPGRVAEDGASNHSAYTAALLKRMPTAGMKVEELFKAVRGDVLSATSGKQTPWENTSLTGDFYFVRPPGAVVAAASAPAPLAPPVGAPMAVPPRADRSGSTLDWVAVPGRALEMSRTEVTVAQYRACVDAGACEAPKCPLLYSSTWGEAGKDDYPVNCVDWTQAGAFARWAGGRLPTGDEWEHAAKGGKDQKYAGSDDVDEVAWMVRNAGGGPHAVGLKRPNGYGLHDMSGNVWEWCADASLIGRAVRGGAYNALALYERIGLNQFEPGALRAPTIGFRVVRDVK